MLIGSKFNTIIYAPKTKKNPFIDHKEQKFVPLENIRL